MKVYEVRLTKAAAKSLFKINQSLPAIGKKLSQRIESLKANPYLGAKLEGSDGNVRRIRVGDYRLIYEIHESYLLIIVLYVGPRGGAY